MTRQTVSICNIRGGVALDADEANALADLLEGVPDAARNLGARFRFRRVIDVLRGVEPREREPRDQLGLAADWGD